MASKFKKQSYEEFVIAADFTANMDISGGEDLVLGDTEVTATDKDGTDVTSTVTDPASKTIGTGTEQGYLKILVRAGSEDASPYKITFKTGETTAGEKWELDVTMTIKEK